ncbi:3'(2'),5'-bisphosphate nucleotidase CysQ [Allorhizobium sp. BGMRC 0089]|uniref:3'(2'),5'-bisphosphate nucleotidase CysQ n=1 Tax=Allorhizobium sonneratiae TaxID=2934936 RepID=UPI0020336847|nr:3'(2'),5'-bisphosphate nucleotidase CysQ [Allorhizobium sonneratiae]MCM2291314.1 3'(2'),5'-bisphosphate nucleotidase CysQ [Allorhizobium sonneratiae]
MNQSGADLDGAWSDDLRLIAEAATDAGRLALSHFGASPEVWWKNEGRSPVSAADYAANALLEARLRPARPGYGWLSEETDDDQTRLDRETVFIIDPIDGTRAFLAGQKTWCVSVAVVHQGRPVAAALVAPALDEIFLASATGPALLNGQVLSVTPFRDDAVLDVASPAELIGAFAERETAQSLNRVPHVPSLAYRIAMVAAGRIDATLVLKNAHDWDLAAADLILEKAGGVLISTDGTPLTYNRARVRHGHLAAAGREAITRLIPVFSTFV